MRNLKLLIEYDGTAFSGWQVQPNGRTIQGELERALERVTGVPQRLRGAGRTDAGVHALGQVANLRTESALPLAAFVAGVNAHLPKEIAVRSAEEAPESFDARRSAAGKLYRYRIVNRPGRAPLSRRYAWEHFRPLQLGAMQEGAALLLGRHDFSAFRASDCEAKSTVRSLRRLELTQCGEELTIELVADAFLKHMVRNIVGSLVAVGLGRYPPAWMGELLAKGDRRLAGATAPAQGLCLVEVYY